MSNAFADGVFKFNPHDPDSMIGRVLKSATGKTNAGKMSCQVIISTQDEDYSNDVIVTKGIRLDNHRKNPIGLFAHKADAPIGRFADPLGAYTVKMRGETQLVGELFFNQSSQLAHDVFRCVEERAFNAVSIGAKPVYGKVEKRAGGGVVYHEMVMVEASILPMGDNPNAIIEIVHKSINGKPICDPLRQILLPYCPERPACVTSGWEYTPAPAQGQTVTKAAAEYDDMNDDENKDEFAPVDPPADDAMSTNDQPQDDMPADDMGGMGDTPGHEEVVSQSFEAAGHAILSAWTKGELDGESAMKKLEVFFDAKSKLDGAGDDSDEMPDVGENVEDVSEDDDSDDSEDDDDLEEKAFYSEADAEYIRKAFKFFAAIEATPKLDPRKLVGHARVLRKAFGNIDPVVKMVRKAKAAKAASDPWNAPAPELADVVKSLSRQMRDVQTVVGRIVDH